MIQQFFQKIKSCLRRPFGCNDPADYSATQGKGTIVPVQIEAYFLGLNRFVHEGDRILDVGFGLGTGLTILSIKAKEVNGIDVDEKSLEYCRGVIVGRNPKLHSLGIYDGEKIPFQDSFFDIVTCVDVIEHVENFDSFIKEMIRVSKRGVFISTPNRRTEYTNKDGTPKNFWHLREWNYAEFSEIVRKHGKSEWHFINGPWEGPFNISEKPDDTTMALTVFILNLKCRA